MPKNEPVRLAIVRCDSHAYWFAPYLDEVDPVVLATYSDDAPTRQEVHWHGCSKANYGAMAIERVPGFAITKVFDRVGDRSFYNTDPELLQYGSYPGRGLAFCDTLSGRPQLCDTIEQATEDVDAAFICDSSSPKDGMDHLELTRPFLEKGIPCFVDKPFAGSYADAKQMVDLAKANGTALMTASLQSYTLESAAFRRRFDEIGQPGLLTVKGVGYSNSAVVHGLSAALNLFGYGVESVECMGSHPLPDPEHWTSSDCKHHLEHLLLHYPDGRQAIVMNTHHDWFTAESEFYFSAYGKQGAVHSTGVGIRQFPPASKKIIELFVQLVQTGEPPIPYEHILELIAIIEAARISQAKSGRISLQEVTREPSSMS